MKWQGCQMSEAFALNRYEYRNEKLMKPEMQPRGFKPKLAG